MSDERKISIYLSVAAYNVLPRIQLEGESVSAAISRLIATEAVRSNLDLRKVSSENLCDIIRADK